MTTRIRLANEHDTEQLSTLSRQTFSDNFGHLYTAENLEYHLQKTCSPEFFAGALEGGDVITVACEGEHLVGYAKGGLVGLPVENLPAGYDPAQSREIHRLYVTTPFQTKGIGHALMQSLMDMPDIAGARMLYLGVWENNTRAQRFYARYGFATISEYRYYVGTHVDRELIMARENY